MRSAVLALSVLVAGCLDSPPASLDVDAAHGDDATQKADAGCTPLAPLAPFSDDFSDDTLAWVVGPAPGRSGPGDIIMTVGDGDLTFVPGASADDSAWLQSGPFDFSNGRVAARIPTSTTDRGAAPYFGIIGPGPTEKMLRFHGTTMSGPSGTEYEYSQTGQLWWQVMSDEGVFRYQVSPDGIEWTDLESETPGFTLVEVIFEVGVNVSSADDGERGEFVVDDLDLPPC